MSAARRLVWLPPLLVGAAAAMAVFTSTALLLYQGEGLARAVAVIAFVSALSLALGLWTGAREGGRDTVPSAGRWWVGLLVALVLAAGFSGLWDAFQGFGASRAAQGTGLALMTALPTYFAGGVLGRIGSFTETLARGARGRILLGAAAGMTLGAVLVMYALGRPVLAVSAFLAAAIAASLGARIQGWIFDRVPRLGSVLESESRPDLRLETWHVASKDLTQRILTAGYERIVEDPAPPGGWRAGMREMLAPSTPVHFVGVGAWFPVAGDAGWTIYDPDRALLDLASRGFEWSRASIAPAPAPSLPRATVLVDRRSLEAALGVAGGAEAFVRALVLADVHTWLIGGDRAPVPDALVDVALRHYGCLEYSGRTRGQEGPPRIPSRWERAWWFQSDRTGPESIGDLAMLTGSPGG